MLYIMVGRPFAGKTTLRKELVKRFGFDVASVDWEIDNRGMKLSQMNQEDWDLVYSETFKKLEKLLRNGKTVILDLGNLKKSDRNSAIDMARYVKVPYKTIYINTSLDEVTKRWKENQKNGVRKMEKSVFEQGQNMFEEPIDEDVIIYNSTIDLNSWIAKNIAKE